MQTELLPNMIAPIMVSEYQEAVNTAKHMAWATEKRVIIGKFYRGRGYFVAQSGITPNPNLWESVHLVTPDLKVL